jgi:hypothetical protein
MTDFDLLYIYESSEEGWKQNLIDEFNNMSSFFSIVIDANFSVLSFDIVKKKLFPYHHCKLSGNSSEKMYSWFIYNLFLSRISELINAYSKFQNYNKVDELGDTNEIKANPYTSQEETISKTLSKNTLNWKLTNDILTFEPWLNILENIVTEVKGIVVKASYPPEIDDNPEPPR